ncbi:MAG: hypothetical protein KDA74_17645, partial [Planctomycetaceae bacterium]|nr:hypothetical protein [Planctomycetaceae bacterium]
MTTLNNLRTTLAARFQGQQPQILASDFAGIAADTFSKFLGTDPLSMTQGNVGEITVDRFHVTGRATLFAIEIDIDFLIVDQDSSLHFIVKPQAPLPADWRFSKSFANLKGTFFDNLSLSEVYLILTSFDPTVETPQAILKPGLNFLGKADLDDALLGLKSLYTAETKIDLQGIITRDQNLYNVDLVADLQQLSLDLTAPKLNLTHDSGVAEEEKKNEVVLSGDYEKTDFKFPYEITVPVLLSPLDLLERQLSDRMGDTKELTFKDTDLGELVAPEFFGTLETHEITIEQTTLRRVDDCLKIEGQAALWKLDAKTEITIEVVDHSPRLDYSLSASAPDSWKLSKSFSQFQGSSLDQLVLTHVLFLATSWKHSIKDPEAMLEPGLNLLANSTPVGLLRPLKEIKDAFETLFLQGTITGNAQTSAVQFKTTPLTNEIKFTMLSLNEVKIENAELHLESELKDSKLSDKAFIGGIVKAAPFEDYAGQLFIPGVGTQLNWNLSVADQKPVNVPAFSSMLEFFGTDNSLTSTFPTSLSSMDKLELSRLNIGFELTGRRMESVSIELAFKPDKEGEPPHWEIMPTPHLSVADPRMGLMVGFASYAETERQMVFRCDLSGKFTVGDTHNLLISLSMPLAGDWVLTITPENEQLPSLSDIARLIWSEGSGSESDILNPLPQGLVDSGPQIVLSEIKTGFNPFTPQLSFVSFDLKQQKEWSIVPDILSMDQWAIAMNIAVQPAVKITGLIQGKVKIGTAEKAIADISVKLPVPPAEEGWTVGLTEGTVIEVPRLDRLLALAGGKDSTAGLPKGIADVGGLQVTQLEINFDPQQKKINSFSFGMRSTEDWVIIGDSQEDSQLAVRAIETQFDLKRGSDDKYSTTGYLNGFLVIFNRPIWVAAARKLDSEPWSLTFALSNSLHLPGLADLAGWMAPADVVSYIPETLMPFSKGFELVDLNIQFDLSSTKLDFIQFKIINSEAWQVLPEILSIDQALVAAKIDKSGENTTKLTCLIEGEVTLASLVFKLSAKKETPEAEWKLTGSLEKPAEISFESLFTDVKLSNISLPYDSSFPRSITIQKADVEIVPVEKSFQFELTSQFNWPIVLGPATFSINQLGVKLNIDKKTDDGKRPYTFSATGDFTFAGLSGKGEFTTSNREEVDTIVTLTVTNSASASLPNVARKFLGGEEQSAESWNTVTPNVPAAFTDFGELTVNGVINLSRKRFLIHGSSSRFGAVTFMTTEVSSEEKKWGYFVAAKLADGFEFSSLLSELSVIDGILSFKNGSAGFAISSFDAESLKTLTADTPQFSDMLTSGESTTTVTVKRGVNFYACLDFGSELKSGLFSNLVTLLDDAETRNDLILSGHIYQDTSDSETTSTIASFDASLGDFRVLSLLDFKGIEFNFTKAEEKKFTLTGNMSLALDEGTTDEKKYSFDGKLLINETKADFSITQSSTYEISAPLGMTGVKIEGLFLNFAYDFTSKNKTLNLGGKVKFHESTEFDAGLYLINTSPVLAEVSLDSREHPLGMINFLATCVGIDWPAEYFEISFLSGSVYYYKKSADPKGIYLSSASSGKTITRKADFNLQSTIDIAGHQSSIEMSVSDQGIEASGKMLDSIKIPANGTFAEITDSDFSGSPSLHLKLHRDEKSLGLDAGLRLLNEDFGTGSLKIGKFTNNGQTEAEVRGELKYQGTIEEFTDSKIGFAYNKTNGFRITSWPFNLAAAIKWLELLNTFRKIKGSACSAIAS